MPASDALPAVPQEKIRHRLELVAFALALAYALFLAGCGAAMCAAAALFRQFVPALFDYE